MGIYILQHLQFKAFLLCKLTLLTLFKDNFLCQFYFPGLLSLLHIHTWWGQSKYLRKSEISRANFEKTQNLFILKNFLWILCINMQNCRNSKKLRLNRPWRRNTSMDSGKILFDCQLWGSVGILPPDKNDFLLDVVYQHDLNFHLKE